MQVINEDDRNYRCDVGERVTMTLIPSNPDHFEAKYAFSDAPQATEDVDNNDIEFKIQDDFTRILIVFIFTQSGSCKVKLSGSNGGSFDDPFTISKTGNVPVTDYWTFKT